VSGRGIALLGWVSTVAAARLIAFCLREEDVDEESRGPPLTRACAARFTTGMPHRLMIGLICVARAHRADPPSQGRVTKQDGLWCFCPAGIETRTHEWRAITPPVPLSDIARGRFRGIGNLRTLKASPGFSAGKKSLRQP
jgi:hypothetical protein